MVVLQSATGTHRHGWALVLAALAACSSPSTGNNGNGAGADTGDQSDALVFQNDVKKQDVPTLPDVPGPDVSADGLLADAAPDALPDSAADTAPADAGSAFAHLCAPCSGNATCQTGSGSNLCLADDGNGSFCGAQCSVTDAKGCPTGFSCLPVTDPASGQSVGQCLPNSGSCLCSATAIAQGTSVACARTNGYGTCVGKRVCSADGGLPCDAPVPASETCNNIDDDCNGKTDDLPAGVACTNSNAAGACTGTLTGCQDGVPLCNAQTPVAEICNGVDDNCNGVVDEGMCDDGNPCTAGICGSDGSCGQLPQSGASCDDGNTCTTNDTCVNGKCQGLAVPCDDQNPCTTDSCDLASGCTHTANLEACTDDGNSCTIDACIAGACTHNSMGDGATCKDDGNGCTLDGCLAGVCVHTDDPFDPPCADDSNACTLDVCKASACAHLPVPGDVTCTSDNNVCTDDLCQNGACAHPAAANTETTCADDGIACTNDLCAGGKCTHPNVLPGTACADDGLPCTDDVCQTGTCEHPAKAYGAACADDGLPCTADTCKNGVCTHLATLTGQACPDDGDPCTIDVCTVQGGCGHAIDPTKCEIAGVCYAAGQASPTDPCKQCVPTTSQNVFSAAPGQPCEDGNLCTVGEKCSGGSCQGGAPKDCSGSNPNPTCGTVACSKVDGTCVVTPKSGPCDDGDVCTASDHCVAGACTGTPKDCSPFDTVCTTGTCSGGTCSAVPKAGACDDGDPCTLNDACSNNKCVGTVLDCSGLNSVCGTGSCQGGTCVATPKVGSLGCDDGNGCTFNDQCSAGLCVGIAVNCTNLNGLCVQGICDPTTTGCVLKYSPATDACSDGDACTQNDHCNGEGKCTGTPLICPGTNNPCSMSYCAGGKCQVIASGDGNACSDGSTCTQSDACSKGSCQGQPIYDQYEPNNSPNGAGILGKSDCDGSSALGASISPAQDVDFYHFQATDAYFCSIYPDVSITGLAADYDLCVWFRCNSGASDSSSVACDAGYLSSGGPNGEWGCCSSNSGTANEHVRHNDTCSFLGAGDDGGLVTIQVFPKDAAAASMCGGYTLTWKAN